MYADGWEKAFSSKRGGPKAAQKKATPSKKAAPSKKSSPKRKAKKK